MRATVFLVILAFAVPATAADCPIQGATAVTIGAQRWEVETASTPAERSRGLSFRPGLAASTGMLFVLASPGLQGFWMKDMRFPLDIVWVGSGNAVLQGVTAQPCRQAECPILQPPAPVAYVLEVNAGEFRGKPGETLTWQCGARP
ncbi:MAG: DUF192 domain-containing protein [Betaproteobacteria bacterium]|nr:DUF192 domain-containing protein [Betaproteobacteria bacterium]